MDTITTITTKGQVTIPHSVRQALGTKIGDKVSFTRVLPEAKEAVIKIIPAHVVEELSGSLSSKVKENDHKKVRVEAGKLLVNKYIHKK
jgi:AbrB family looped-hinge helix DNA binding protein